MSFVMASCVLLLALLVGVVIDDITVSGKQDVQRNIRAFDAW